MQDDSADDDGTQSLKYSTNTNIPVHCISTKNAKYDDLTANNTFHTLRNTTTSVRQQTLKTKKIQNGDDDKDDICRQQDLIYVSSLDKHRAWSLAHHSYDNEWYRYFFVTIRYTMMMIIIITTMKSAQQPT